MTSNQRLKLSIISELATIFKILSTVCLVTIILEYVVGIKLHESYPFKGSCGFIAWLVASLLESVFKVLKQKLKRKYQQ